MNRFQRKVALRVLGIHGGVILVLVMMSGLKGCFLPKPKPEIMTFIEFGQAAPSVAIERVEQMADPTPLPVEAPEPAPPPEVVEVPKPIDVPTPVKKTVPKPPVKKVVQKPKPREAPKPKRRLATAKDIKIGPKVKPTKPVKPAVSSSDIAKALKSVQSQSPSVNSSRPATGPVGNPNAISAYDAHIYNAFYNAWERPGSPASRPAKVTISISSTGRVLSSRLSQSSGDSNFDASVMSAVRRISTLPKRPPTGYPLNNIVVQFTIVD